MIRSLRSVPGSLTEAGKTSFCVRQVVKDGAIQRGPPVVRGVIGAEYITGFGGIGSFRPALCEYPEWIDTDIGRGIIIGEIFLSIEKQAGGRHRYRMFGIDVLVLDVLAAGQCQASCKQRYNG